MAVIVRKAKRRNLKGPEPTYAALHRVADRNVAPLARAFLDAFDRLRGMHSEDEWEQAVGRGAWPGLVADLERISFVKAIDPAELDPLANTLVNVAVDAGSAMISYQGLDATGIATVTNSFTVVNPLAVQWAQQYAAALVTGVVVESQNAIRGIISNAMQNGGAPRDTAQLIRHTIGLNQRQVSAIGNYRAGLVKDGVDPLRIETLVRRKAERALKDRALTIARTETMSAANHGQQLLWGEMHRLRLLDPSMRKIFIVTHDDRLCFRCMAMDGQTVEVIGGRFMEASGAMAEQPPIHPRCRCTTGLVEGDTKQPAATMPEVGVDPGSPLSELPGGKVGAGVRKGLDAIGRVHRVPDGMLPVPVKTSSARTYHGVYEYRLDAAKTPKAIRISSNGDHHASTFAHEYGHYLDAQGGLVEQFSLTAQANRTDPLVKAWVDAVDASPSIQSMRELAAGPKARYDGSRYYMQRNEMWARSYAQWIAERSGDTTMLEEIASIQGRDGAVGFSQWAPEEFRPIAEALDAIFRAKGLLR